MIKGDSIAVIGCIVAIIIMIVGGILTFYEISMVADKIELDLSKTHTVKRGSMDSPSIVISLNRTEFNERLVNHTRIYRSGSSFILLEESNTIAYSFQDFTSTPILRVFVCAFGIIGLGVLLGVLRNTVWKDKK